MKLILFLTITAILNFAFAGEIKLSLGTSPMTNIFSKIKEPYEKASGNKITYSHADPKGQGADLVYKDICEGKADGGAGGTPMDDWLSMMKDKGYSHPDQALIKSRVIGRDRVQIVINKENTVSKLTNDQIIGLFSGKIKNWKELGGPAVPVLVVISSKKQPATNNFFEKKVLKGQKIIAGKDVPDMPDLKAAVIADKGAIAFGNVEFADDKVKKPEFETIGRPITFIYKNKTTPDVENLLQFIEKEGAKHGVVR